MYLKHFGTSVALIVCSGCGSAIQVAHLKSVSGVPFYVKVATCKQETVWLEPTYKVSLAKTVPLPIAGGPQKQNDAGDKKAPDGAGIPIGVRLISLSTYDSKAFQELILLVENSKETQDEDPILDAFRKLPPYVIPREGLPVAENRLLASNQNAAEVMVNYADKYYYNAKKPVIGTVNATVELNADGTLSKGTAQIEDKTLQAFLDLIPVKDVVSAAAKGALGIAALEGGKGLVQLKLTIEPQIYKYTLSKNGSIAQTLPCPKPADPLDNYKEANFSRVTVSADDSAKKANDAQNVKFAGTVELPKADDTKKAAPPK